MDPKKNDGDETIASKKKTDSSNQTHPQDSRSRNISTSGTQRSSERGTSEPVHSDHNWTNLFFGQLPLQTETTTFILINCLDIFLTNILLRKGAIEANPIADYFMQRWGFYGAIAFKLAIVAVVAVIAQIVAIKKLETARALLILGTLIVGAVVAYSISLYFKHFA